MARHKRPPKNKQSLHSERQKSKSDSTSSSILDESTNSTNKASPNKRKSTPRKLTPKTGKKSYAERERVVVKRFGKNEVFYRKTFKEINYLQKTVENLIPKLPFSRLIKEIITDVATGSQILRVKASALAALQESAELYLVCLFCDTNVVAHHAKRQTIKPSDMALVLRLRQNQ